MATQTMKRGMSRAVAASAFLALGVGVAPTAANAAESLDAGSVTVVAGAESSQRRHGGGSDTEFSLQLPKGASCPGDSANDGYRVQTFIVPGTDDPGTLRYKSTKPDGDGRYALYDTYTRPYVQGMTAEADSPGAPGLIIDIPTFSFAVFPPGELPAGRYRVGVACTLINETKRFWGTEFELARAPDDPPAEIHWTVVGTQNGLAPASQARVTVVLVALAVVAAAVVLVRRRDRRHTPALTEER